MTKLILIFILTFLPLIDAYAMYDIELMGPIDLRSSTPKAQFRLTPTQGGTPITYDADLTKIKVEGFQSFFPPNLSTLDPLQPFPHGFNFGRSRKRVSCKFDYNNQVYKWKGVDTYTPHYAHQAEWDFPVQGIDYQQHTTLASLLLKVQLEDTSFHEVLRQHVIINHQAGALGAHQIGRHYYDGLQVFLRQYVPQTWTEPKSNQQYTGYHRSSDEDIPTHKGSKVIYVEPIPITGQKVVSIPSDYEGDYDPLGVGIIPPQDRKAYIDSKYLIYSDGVDLYPTIITQELWQRNNWQVGFGISSYKDIFKVKLNPNAFIGGTTALPEGIYYKKDTKNAPQERIEKWVRLEPFKSNLSAYDIEVPKNEKTFHHDFILDNPNADEGAEYLAKSQILTEISIKVDLLNDAYFLTKLYATLGQCQGLETLMAKGVGIISAQNLSSLSQNLNRTNPTLQLFGDVETKINGPAEAQSFATHLAQPIGLKILKIEGIGLGDAGVLSFTPYLSALKDLITMNLKNNQLTNAAFQALSQGASYLTNLNTLDLSENVYVPVSYVYTMCQSAMKLTNFKLNAEINGSSEAQQLYSALTISSAPQVLKLKVRGIGSAGTPSIVQSFPFFSQLIELDLAQCALGDDGAHIIIKNFNLLPNLTTLNFSSCNLSPKVLFDIKGTLPGYVLRSGLPPIPNSLSHIDFSSNPDILSARLKGQISGNFIQLLQEKIKTIKLPLI